MTDAPHGDEKHPRDEGFFGVVPVALYLAAIPSTFRSSAPRMASISALFSSACLRIKATLFLIFSPYSAFFFSNPSWQYSQT